MTQTQVQLILQLNMYNNNKRKEKEANWERTTPMELLWKTFLTFHLVETTITKIGWAQQTLGKSILLDRIISGNFVLPCLFYAKSSHIFIASLRSSLATDTLVTYSTLSLNYEILQCGILLHL